MLSSYLDDKALIKQGAEGRIYRVHGLGEDLLVKYRFPKTYRHPALDSLLTQQRITAEARNLVRCQRAGLRVPTLRAVDAKTGILAMQYIDGLTLKQVLGSVEERKRNLESAAFRESDAAVIRKIGTVVAQMHIAQVVHGDLTTSNMIYRNDEIFLIDFGLASKSVLPEERAVDLYVLERAISSTHDDSGYIIGIIVDAYRNAWVDAKKRAEGDAILRRLNKVRLRGRKRSMVG